MPDYLDLSTVHVPTLDAAAPVAWGLQVRDNFERIVRPPRCRVRRTSSKSVATGTFTAIDWTDAPIDTGFPGASPHWASGSPTQLVIRATGHYLIGFTARWPSNASGARLVWARLNGVTTVALHETAAAASSWNIGSSPERGYDLVAGDVLELFAYQTSGGSLAIGTDGPLEMYLRWIGYQ
jgi:hypothetical protein